MGTHPIFESDFDCLTEEMEVLKTDLERRLETEGTIRIGPKYQCDHLPRVGITESGDNDEPSKCFWTPGQVKDGCAEFVERASELGWPQYAALSLLAELEYDQSKALEKLDEFEFVNIDERWSGEDRLIFQSVFGMFGKNFEKIHCWLEHKTMKELVEFYYHLKSTKQIITSSGQKEEKTLPGNTDSKLKRCAAKINHFEQVYDIGELQKDIRRTCATINMDNSEELEIARLKHEIIQQRIDVQKRKTRCAALNETGRREISEIERLVSSGEQRQIFRWEDQEIFYFSMALKEYGKDYKMISRIIQTKQPAQLEKFYNENSEKFLLNAAYQEYLNNQKEDSDIEEIENNFEIETIE